MDFAQVQSRRVGRTAIVWSSIALVALLLISLGIFIIGKPFPKADTFADSSELDDIYLYGSDYVEVTVDELWTTGYYNYKSVNGGKETVTDRYFYFDMTDTDLYIFVKMPKSFDKETYQNLKLRGKLRKLEYGDETGKLLPGFAADWAEYSGVPVEETTTWFSPYIIDKTQTKLTEQICFFAFLAGALGMLAVLIKNIHDVQDHTRTKAFLRLGNGDPQRAQLVSEQAGAEFDLPLYSPHKTIRFTQNWIIHTPQNTYAAFAKNELLWMYKHVVQHRYNGIPTGKTYSVVLRFANTAYSCQIPAKNDRAADEIMEGIFNYHNELLVGYTDENTIAYNQRVQEAKLEG